MDLKPWHENPSEWHGEGQTHSPELGLTDVSLENLFFHCLEVPLAYPKQKSHHNFFSGDLSRIWK